MLVENGQGALRFPGVLFVNCRHLEVLRVEKLVASGVPQVRLQLGQCESGPLIMLCTVPGSGTPAELLCGMGVRQPVADGQRLEKRPFGYGDRGHLAEWMRRL